tara:strand:+ start:2051 stop:2359 length:309 start_codon:yes stop_codon:yes gene_type:complete
MIAVKNISINLSAEDSKSKAVLDFSPISSIAKGDSIYLSVKNESIYLNAITDTSTTKWIDWIVSTYNMLPNAAALLSRDNSNLVVLGSNSDDLNIELDLGEV